ncbi:MAG TPA: ShlB/FhaC/HecB family hemolysin secretion/activation protein, partial [Pantoea sp.]|nr:ShlB/FhaC/HecB family hemolysin secretion/activation protein [Pantoea sp.]
MMAKSGMLLALCVSLLATSAMAAPLNPADRDYIQNQQQQRPNQDP